MYRLFLENSKDLVKNLYLEARLCAIHILKPNYIYSDLMSNTYVLTRSNVSPIKVSDQISFQIYK